MSTLDSKVNYNSNSITLKFWKCALNPRSILFQRVSAHWLVERTAFSSRTTVAATPWCVLFQFWSSAVILDIIDQALPAAWGAGFIYPAQQARDPIFGGEAEPDMCYQLQYPQRQRERGDADTHPSRCHFPSDSQVFLYHSILGSAHLRERWMAEAEGSYTNSQNTERWKLQ